MKKRCELETEISEIICDQSISDVEKDREVWELVSDYLNDVESEIVSAFDKLESVKDSLY